MIKFICDVFITGFKIDLAIFYIGLFIFGGSTVFYLLYNTENALYWFIAWFAFIVIYAFIQSHKEFKDKEKLKKQLEKKQTKYIIIK